MIKELLEHYLSHLDEFVEEFSKLDKINNLMIFVYKLEEDGVKFGSPLRSNGSKRLEDAIYYIRFMSHRRDVYIDLWAQDFRDKEGGLVKIGVGARKDEQFNEIYRRLSKISGPIENKIENFYKYDFKLK